MYIRPDLTPLQQKGRRELVAKFREKKASVADTEDWKIDYRRWEVVHKPPQPTPIASTNVNNVHNELNVWYTNSDQFLNKIDELKLRIYNADTKPSIIAITEVNPKNNRNPIIMSELKIDNFLEPLYNPDGRGICIYLANTHDLTGYKTDHRAVLAFTDQCTSGGTGQHWSVYTREASEIFKLSGC